MKDVLEQLKTFWGSMPPRRRWIAALTVAATLVLTGVGVWLGSRPDLVALYPGLTDEDTASVLTWLRGHGIPHELEKGAGGKSAVMVPKDRVGEIRIELAAEGIPAAGSAEGFGLIDRQAFGVSEGVAQLNRVRALQGELARTISNIQGVVNARVHLAIPDRGTLSVRRDPPSASVMVRLKTGVSLTKSQVKGIVNLVAQSVPGLTPNTVSLIDGAGAPLFTPKKDEGGDPDEAGEQEKQIARGMEEKVLRLLENVVGTGNVVANVSVDLDRSRVEQTEENYDPDTVAVRSEQKQSDVRGEQSGLKSGVPGVQANTPEVAAAAAAPGGPDASSNANRSLELTNYEVSKTVRRISTPAGAVKRLSLAVIVDGSYEGADNKYVPRTPEEMSRLTALAKTAVGFDASRGDTFEIANAAFPANVPEPMQAPLPETQLDKVKPFLTPGLLALVLLALVAVLLRTVLRKKQPPVTIEVLKAQLAAEEAKALGVGEEAQAGLPAGEGAVGLGEGEAVAALSSGMMRSALDPSLELQLEEILRAIGTDPAEIEDAQQAAERNQRLESALKELAATHPKAIATALTTWMNERNA